MLFSCRNNCFEYVKRCFALVFHFFQVLKAGWMKLLLCLCTGNHFLVEICMRSQLTLVVSWNKASYTLAHMGHWLNLNFTFPTHAKYYRVEVCSIAKPTKRCLKTLTLNRASKSLIENRVCRHILLPMQCGIAQQFLTYFEVILMNFMLKKQQIFIYSSKWMHKNKFENNIHEPCLVIHFLGSFWESLLRYLTLEIAICFEFQNFSLQMKTTIVGLQKKPSLLVQLSSHCLDSQFYFVAQCNRNGSYIRILHIYTYCMHTHNYIYILV